MFSWLEHFVNRFKNTINRSEIEENLRFAKKDIKEHVQGMLLEMNDVFKDHKWQNPELQKMQSGVMKRLNIKTNFLPAIQEAINVAEEVVNTLDSLVVKNFDEKTIPSGLTYKKANILMVLNNIRFLARYTRAFLIYVTALETSVLTKQQADKRLTPAQIKFVKDKFDYYVRMVEVFMTNNPKRIVSDLDKIADILIMEDTNKALGNLGQGMAGINRNMALGYADNSLMHLRQMSNALATHDEYMQLKMEHSLLTYKLEQYRELQRTGTRDAALEMKIEQTNGLVNGIQKRISEIDALIDEED